MKEVLAATWSGKEVTKKFFSDHVVRRGDGGCSDHVVWKRDAEKCFGDHAIRRRGGKGSFSDNKEAMKNVLVTT